MGTGIPFCGEGEEVCCGCACVLHSEWLTVLSGIDYTRNMENSNRIMKINELQLTNKEKHECKYPKIKAELALKIFQIRREKSKKHLIFRLKILVTFALLN